MLPAREKKGNIMSVPKSKRSDDAKEFDTGNAAFDLVKYSYDRTKPRKDGDNSNQFPKSEKYGICKDIRDMSRRAYILVRHANRIYPVHSKEDLDTRNKDQKKASELVGTLLDTIELSYRFGWITGHQAETWTDHCQKVLNMIKEWSKSDKMRYKELKDESCNFDDTPNPANANNARNVNPSGTINNNNANNGNGCVPDCVKDEEAGMSSHDGESSA